jgi:hypothetical protein
MAARGLTSGYSAAWLRPDNGGLTHCHPTPSRPSSYFRLPSGSTNPLPALAAALLAGALLATGTAAQAATEPEGYRYEAFFSPYTHHWTFSEEHRQVVNLSLSQRLPNDRFRGLSLFTNSFGQPSAYAFVGKSWPGLVPGLPNVYASVSAGIIYGYVDEYKDKVPLNLGGFSPVVIPAVGVRLSPRAAVEVQILGTAALMFGTTWRF